MTTTTITLPEARRLLALLERLSVDSQWARRASGTRGNLVRLLDELDGRDTPTPAEQARLDQVGARAYELLTLAGRELRGDESLPGRLPVPWERSYWVIPGRLLAGAYPGDKTDAIARQKLAAIAAAGVTCFIDLTCEGELRPYAGLLPEIAPPGRSLAHFRRPIVDLSVPTPAALAETLDLLERQMLLGEVPYLHCWGGKGRTGTVVGALFVRRGISGPAALASITSLRQRMPDYDRQAASPETGEQIAMVLGWKG
jgi:hypothetical protein